VHWTHEGKVISKSYRNPIRSAVPLNDQTGVAVVEPFEEKGRDNAILFNADGSECFRLKFPLPEPCGNCYAQMYYAEGRLTAFANEQGNDFAYELNQETGAVLRRYETR
jgi:hypothetical protein